MLEIECIQLTPEWWEARRGIPTASDFDRIMTPKKRKASGGQDRYIAQLIGDITDLSPNYFSSQGGPVNASVEYGRATEDEARRWYADFTGRAVRQVGFCKTDDGRFGCSPDGLVDPEGCLELKCPDRDTHTLYLMKDELPLAYWCQVHGELIVTGRSWCDFVSYCVGLPPLVKRVSPDDFTMRLRTELELFWTKFQAVKERLNVGKEEAALSPTTIKAMEVYKTRLAELDEERRIGEWTEEDIRSRVNDWIKDIKNGAERLDGQAKREVWHLLLAYAKTQNPVWHFDAANMMFRLEESVGF